MIAGLVQGSQSRQPLEGHRGSSSLEAVVAPSVEQLRPNSLSVSPGAEKPETLIPSFVCVKWIVLVRRSEAAT
jgi:hypothetical protein